MPTTHPLPLGATLALAAIASGQKFETVEIDAEVKIGYGLAIADMNADGKPDIVLVDRDAVVWYANPGWKKHRVCGHIGKRDHVCIAARDLDGDGRAELALGGEWNPGDTVGSGSVHYLSPGSDREAPWRPIALHREPTVHRMRWVRRDGTNFDLVVAPLHGRKNRSGRGPGVRLLAYGRRGDPSKADSWQTRPIDDRLHVTHNFDPVQWDVDPAEELLVASREGLFLFDRIAAPDAKKPDVQGWRAIQLTGPKVGERAFRGAGEVRAGRGPGKRRFVTAVEPFHGHQLTYYTPPEDDGKRWRRTVVADDMKQGHALACADFLDTGADQIVVGWRNKNAKGTVGVRLHVPPATPDGTWRAHDIDLGGMACEDLRVADLDGDGRPDIAAAGRATHNLRIYFNRTK